jgi:hypothetical protein
MDRAVGRGALGPDVSRRRLYQWFRGVSLKVQAGVQWRLARFGGVFVEYRLTLAHLDVTAPGGDLSTWLRTHHVIAGAFVAL